MKIENILKILEDKKRGLEERLNGLIEIKKECQKRIKEFKEKTMHTREKFFSQTKNNNLIEVNTDYRTRVAYYESKIFEYISCLNELHSLEQELIKEFNDVTGQIKALEKYHERIKKKELDGRKKKEEREIHDYIVSRWNEE